MLALILTTVYAVGYAAFIVLAGVGVGKNWRLVLGGVIGWVLWNVAWFTSAALIH